MPVGQITAPEAFLYLAVYQSCKTVTVGRSCVSSLVLMWFNEGFPGQEGGGFSVGLQSQLTVGFCEMNVS